MKFEALARVGPVKGLVQYQDLGVVDQGSGQPHTLTHASRIGAKGTALDILQTHCLDRPVNGRPKR